MTSKSDQPYVPFFKPTMPPADKVDPTADEATLGAIVADVGPATVPKREPIQGRYIRLEPVHESHCSPLWSSIGMHDDIFIHWPDGPYTDEAHWTKNFNELAAMTSIIGFTVFKDDEPVGILFFQPADLESRVIEIGLLYGPRIQRTRAATEGLYMLLRIAFDDTGNRRAEWKTSGTNIPSQRAAERIGLVYEGRLRQHRVQKGRNRDTIWYSMIDTEWPLCKRALEAWLDKSNFDEDGQQKKQLVDIRRSMAEEEGAS